ncbi:MAG: DUF883 domain-containing protein [Planctomycetota bacterium]|nr:DUF883 domain-containing protein [Planctomycetota bacterium]
MSQYSDPNAKSTDMRQGFRDDVGHVKDDLSRLKEDVSTTARDISGAARSGIDAVREQGTETVDHARDAIRANPLAAAAIAFGAGVLLASMMRRM